MELNQPSRMGKISPMTKSWSPKQQPLGQRVLPGTALCSTALPWATLRLFPLSLPNIGGCHSLFL